jgi:hypothetical protein
MMTTLPEDLLDPACQPSGMIIDVTTPVPRTIAAIT